MDEFAQTGAQQDDLFDDIQYDNSMQTRAPDDLFNDEIQPVNEQESSAQEHLKASSPQESPTTEPVVVAEVPTPSTDPKAAVDQTQPSRGRGGRGRGRGRGRNNPDRSTPDARPKPSNEQQPTDSTEAPKPATNAVRGDRLATGGLRKPKLSEQELAEKMSRISLKNEKLAAAHARAEADAANFAEREEAAAKRRQEERKDRQQMMGEREKNRLRKLKAIGGREWDAEKPDEADAFGGPRQSGGRGRGAHGGVARQPGSGASREGFGGDREDYTDGREYMYREDRGRGRGRGRGGRGGGRGGHVSQQDKQQQQSVPKAADFPDLSGSSAPKFDSAPPPTMAFPTKAKAEKEETIDITTPGTEKKSWADMME